MRFRAPTTIFAEVKTPLFIWDGNTVEPISFALDNDRVLVINGDRFIQALSPEGQDAYLAWIEPQLERLTQLDERLEQAHSNRDLRRQLNRDRRRVVANLSMERFVRKFLSQNAAALVKAAGCVAYSVR